jgi:Polyketide cyclase / dehydrase and lipid transport
MSVDVTSSIVIRCPRRDVAAYSANPDNATAWYANIKEIQWETPPPVTVGSRIAFVASFLGRRLAYTYEITTLLPGERMVMKTSEGPFPMETTYSWEDAPEGSTRMSLRNRGSPAGFSALVAPLMTLSIRRANQQDLARLKEILEAAV